MRTLTLETGNSPAWALKRSEHTGATLHFGTAIVDFDTEKWKTFVTIVVNTSRQVLWRNSRKLSKLDSIAGARQAVDQCTSTPKTQLMLAGIDIAERFEFMNGKLDDDLLGEFERREHMISSLSGPDGVYFIPEGQISPLAKELLEKLMKFNKLCRATLSTDTTTVYRYYIPYTVPPTLERDLGGSASELWNKIRSDYYRYRHPRAL